ncbi:uncharacterized protein LOC128394306 [Panonychus citri]|uniref:uncharacterized protein LOC128394306 n=1 Tax=Panonychus citri TaxID=50023 RepID=UPI002307E06B|nr:uncharacterized protein LOC128394306 [Panonychus citri]
MDVGASEDNILPDKSRNYTSFGVDSIKLFASSVNSINPIDDQVFAQLSEDTSYRLRELIASSFQYTRHSKRFKLTCDDINKALKVADSQSIYGFNGSQSTKEIYIPEAEVFVTEDKTIDLVKMSESIISKSYKVNLIAESPQYRIDWLNPTGGSRLMKEFNQPGPDEKPSPEYLQLMKIFNCISKGIISRNIFLFHKTLTGLTSHSNVQHILSYLVKFIANNVAKTSDGKIARQLLLSIRALSKNNYLQVTSDIYVTPLVKSVLHCILRGSSDNLYPSQQQQQQQQQSQPPPSTSTSSSTLLTSSSSSTTTTTTTSFPSFNGNSTTTTGDDTNYSINSDLWNLKSFAASILIDMFKEWSTSFVHNKFYNQIIRALITCIRDPSQPYSSHYGAIVTFNRLGFDCIINHLYPTIGTYLNQLYSNQNSDRLLSSNSHDILGCQQVIGAWINLSLFLVRKFRDMALTENNFQSQHIVKELLNHFGDSLAIQLPIDFPEPEKVYIKRAPVKVKVPIISGEELLDAFYETNSLGKYGLTGDHGGKIVSDDDDLRSNSDSIDGKSNESEKDFKRHDGTDLLVESTISDPSLGVKLTIKKIRRQRRSIDELDSLAAQVEEAKRKRKRPRFQNFMDSFSEESENLLLEQVKTKGNLYSHRMIKKTLSMPFESTSWYLIANKLPSIGKQRKSSKLDNCDSHWRRKLFSCTLNTIL